MSFLNIKSYKQLSKTTTKHAFKRGLEVLVYFCNDFDMPDHYIEIWPESDQSELPYVSYAVQQGGTLYLYAKHVDVHKELSKVEDLPMVVKTDKELRSVVAYIADCLKV